MQRRTVLSTAGVCGNQPSEVCEAEQGFMLVGLIVAIFFILLALSIAAPTVAKELQRERELEAVERGNQYVRAIQLYYRKTQSYPASLEALDKTNNVRFLRQRYLDPLTGKADWRLIHVGEAKTTVKGFFGQPLAGLAPGLGAAAGMASSGPAGAGAAGTSNASSSGSNSFGSSSGSSFGSGSSSGSGFGSSSGSSSFGSSSFGSSSGLSSLGSSSTGSTNSTNSSGTGSTPATTGSGTSATDGSTTGTGSTGTGNTNGMPSQSATGFSGSGSPFVGVGIPKQGNSIVAFNQQGTYQTWEFLYDPRIEQLKSRSNILGGGGPASGDAGLGSAAGMSSGIGTGSSNSSFGNSSSSFGSSNSGSGSSSGFGSSSGSGFGSSNSGSGSSGSSFGNSGSSSSGSTPQTPQQ